jgi:branched-chain amino acid transport system permease protein
VAVSLVILSGWGGQISLGQFGLVGVGAAVAGRLAVSWNADFFLVLVAAAVAGAVAAVLIGLPALRLPGLYLAVTTLALGAAMQYFFLNRSYAVGKHLLPPTGDRIVAPCLWDGRVCLGDGVIPTYGFYYFCLAILGGTLLMARAYRRNRAGRAVLAVRENSRAASSYSVHPARTKLGAFAVSGAIAALAGALVAFQSGSIDSSTYGVEPSVRIFITVVIGGLTSLGGAIFGTVVLESIRLFGEDVIKNISLLVTGPGLLLVLMLLPGGFAEGLYRLRDSILRWIAKRNGIEVPSLVADRRIETGEDQAEIIEAAEHHVEEAESFELATGAVGAGER